MSSCLLKLIFSHSSQYEAFSHENVNSVKRCSSRSPSPSVSLDSSNYCSSPEGGYGFAGTSTSSSQSSGGSMYVPNGAFNAASTNGVSAYMQTSNHFSDEDDFLDFNI